MEKPIHEHDCDECIYLGTVDSRDLYVCRGATVVSRWGEYGAYSSGLWASWNGSLRIAADRAIEKGLLSYDRWWEETTILREDEQKRKLKNKLI